MKNVIKGLIFASFALSFAACKSDKPTSDSTATTVANPTTEVAATAPSTSMATPGATTTAMPAPSSGVASAATAAPTPASGVAAISKTATPPVKPGAAQTTPSAPAPAPAGKMTNIKFEENAHNWGSINEDEKMTHFFKFKNTGSNDLIISDAHGSCGCTVPEWPKEPIKPGKSGEIKVVFDSKGKPGDQQKTVTLTANTDPANTVLTIKGNVKAKPTDK
jgi:hypothetical protein